MEGFIHGGAYWLVFIGLISFQFPDHSCIGIADKVILFVHNYSSTNILEKLTSVEQLNEASVIEVVVSGMFRCYVHESPINLLSPNIHIQILQTDLYTFP